MPGAGWVVVVELACDQGVGGEGIVYATVADPVKRAGLRDLGVHELRVFVAPDGRQGKVIIGLDGELVSEASPPDVPRLVSNIAARLEAVGCWPQGGLITDAVASWAG
jgi:hypothetical protein